MQKRHQFCSPLFVLFTLTIGLSNAQAQTVDDETTTPVRTSTVDDGGPSDIIVTEDGVIDLTGQPGIIAVAIDSDNAVSMDGSIVGDDTDDLIGIFVEANRTGEYEQSGTIFFLEDYAREDVDEDDDLDGPLALGTNRIGILLQEGGTHNGSFVFAPGSSIFIEGHGSAGGIFRSQIVGDFVLDGSVSVTGADSVALEFLEDVTGDLLISGPVQAQGANARGIILNGDVAGGVSVESSVLTTGFASTTVTNFIAPDLVDEETETLGERIDAEDLNDSGPALAIAGSIGQGLLINGPVDDFLSQEDLDDETKDTLDDFDENRTAGLLTTIGSSPALWISPDLDATADSDLVIGLVSETVRDTRDDDEDEDFDEVLAVFDYDAGLINRGTISAEGLNVGFDATAVFIEGSGDGQYRTQIIGGIDNSGSIFATAFDAQSIALDLQFGSEIGTLSNSGLISAATATSNDDGAIAIRLAEGSQLSSLYNSGDIFAQQTLNGTQANSVAILDESGELLELTNTGTISAALQDYDVDGEDNVVGEAIAMDLRNASGDTVLVQTREAPRDDTNGDDEIDSDDVRTPSIQGDILFGSGNDFFDLQAGSVLGNVDFGEGDGSFTLRDAEVEGDILFGDGEARLTATNSDLSGDLFFDAGVASIEFLSGSSFSGSIDAGDSELELTVRDAILALDSDSRTQISELKVNGESDIEFNIDPRISEGNALLTVQGRAELGSGTTLRPVIETISSTSFTQTLISADIISFEGSLDDTAVENVPFIYNLELALNQDENQNLDLEFQLKTASELGLDKNQAASYGAVLDVFSADDDLGTALASITTEAEFQQTYNLLLPQRTDASMRYVASLTSAATGALNDRLHLSHRENRSSAWVQEYFSGIDIDPSKDVPGYNGSGIGFAAGYDAPFRPLDRLGGFVSYSSGRFEEKTGGQNPVVTDSLGLGVYASKQIGPLILSASGQISDLSFFSSRNYKLGEARYEIDGEWGGFSSSVNALASSYFQSGDFFIRPALSFDHLSVDQDSYLETGDDLLTVSLAKVNTETSSIAAQANLGMLIDYNQYSIAPEIKLGYRNVLMHTPYETSAAFSGGGGVFNIRSEEMFSDAILFGASFNSNSAILTARLAYDVEISDEGLVQYGGATFKLRF
ncbi:MAG: autotransporter outer membrane beta-barrel domain-containing protein [Pseudomonadota bacterium]